GTTPLLLFNARTIVGAAPDMAIAGLLGWAALAAVLPARTTTDSGAGDGKATWGWSVLTLLLLAAATFTRGALLGVIPPLGAAIAASWLGASSAMPTPTGARKLATLMLSGVWLAVVALIARAVMRDASDFDPWIGGSAVALNPATFDAVVEQVFHAFAPWSALLPLALSRSWSAELDGSGGRQRSGIEHTLQNACLVWVALAYGAQTLFASRYGRDITFLATVPLAVLVALALRDLERTGTRSWAAGIAALLLVGLLLRDFALFPQGVVQGMPIGNLELPKQWNPRKTVSAFLVPFAVCAALGFVGADSPRTLDMRAPYRFLHAQWRRGLGFRLWLITLGSVIGAACVFGLLAYVMPARLHLPSLALKIVRPLTFTPLALAGVALAGQLLLAINARLGAFRFAPLLVAGAIWGGYAGQRYLPRLSNQFSSRDVYATYNKLAKTQEPLAEYHSGSRAAAYYANGEVSELSTVVQLVDYLAGDGQRWVAFPAGELAEIDHAFRTRTGRHLTVVDARSTHTVLAAAQPVPQHADENPFTQIITKTAPIPLQNPISVDFDERVELLGYALDLPHEGYVGAGEAFTLTWYFRSVRKLTSPYRLFVHVDGEGQRIHGDHDPVDGKYAVPLWEPGDIVSDQQKIDVPASSHAGEYVIYMGFYSGDTRLPIKRGPNAGEDRARVGVLRIQ
ncbi:MAG: hypothetical protein RL701_4572, partial [Pseudomonadota bacterium]